jgi:hypothetical protein
MPVLVADLGVANSEVEVDLSRGESPGSSQRDEKSGPDKILSSIFRRW